MLDRWVCSAGLSTITYSQGPTGRHGWSCEFYGPNAEAKARQALHVQQQNDARDRRRAAELDAT
jgi:hypothetical protein